MTASEPPFAKIRITILILYVLLMSAFGLTASPKRPYIHEIFGLELLISWPEGQKLHEEAMELYYAGDYSGSLQKLDKAVAEAERFSNAREKDMAILLTTKADEVILLGDTEDANTLLLRAQQLADRVLATNHPVTARIQSERAVVFFVRGNPAEAKIALERAIATQAARSGTNDVAHARSLSLKALVCLAQGDPAQASLLISQSSQYIENVAGTQSSLYGQNECLKSLIAAAKGEYEKAVQLCESSLTILTNCVGPEHLVLVSVRKALADDYQQLGMYEHAAPLLQDNLRTLERTIGGDNIVLSGVLNSLGQLHYRLGNNSDAERLFRRCLSVQEKNVGVNSPAYAATVNNLALVLIEAGRDEDASTLFKDASSALDKSVGKNSPELATVLLNWGMLSRRLGQSDNAKRLLEEAIAIRDKAFGNNHPAIAEAAEAYAQLQCDLGDYKNAQQLAMLALSIQTNFFRPDHPAMADTISTAARVYAGMNDEYKAAELYGRSALIRARAFGAEHPTVANELEAAGLALCRAGEYAEAAQLLLMALRSQRDYLVQQVASRANGEDGLRLAGKTFYRTELLHSLCALSLSNATASLPAKAAEQLASCKALLEEVQATQASLEADSRTSTRELREKLVAIQNQLARLPESNLDATQRDARRRQLQTEKTQIEEALAEWNGLVAQTIRERNLTLTNIARGLPPQSVLVDFVQYQRYDFAAKTNQWKEQRYAAYLTFPLAHDSTNVVVERVDLGDATPIDAAIGSILGQFKLRQRESLISKSALKQLNQKVYAPLAKHLTNVSHLIICPDGQLSRLPFEMLSHDGRFLIEDKTISYVGSGREVVRIASPKSEVRSSKSLVMGNPDFDFDLVSSHPSNQAVQLVGVTPALRSLKAGYLCKRFVSLAGAETEAKDVAGRLGNDTILLLGKDASKARLQTVASPHVLHLATHGFFFPDQEIKRTNSAARNSAFTRAGPLKDGTADGWENPLVRCGIALAGANHYWPVTNTVPADGSLTGLEASLLNLQGTELVILSACDSGTGEVRIGEGVMSLRRAFRIAGAQTVLASHWNVDDEATCQLMKEFMGRWRSGEPRAKAWREAQLSLLRVKKFSNPYFWAAFTLTGQWR